MSQIRCEVIRCEVISEVIRCEVIRCEVIRCEVIRCEVFQEAERPECEIGSLQTLTSLSDISHIENTPFRRHLPLHLDTILRMTARLRLSHKVCRSPLMADHAIDEDWL